MRTESTWVVLEGLGEGVYGEYVLTRYRVTFSDSVLEPDRGGDYTTLGPY